MTDLLNTAIKDMPGLSFDCGCGRRHSVDIKSILTGSGVLCGLKDILEPFRQGEIFLMADNNTWEACGENVAKLLSDGSFQYKSFVFRAESPLVPDEKAVGRLLLELDGKTSAIVAAGSGTLNDLARFLSCRLGIPYIIACTAPSMDGYASTVSPLIVEGFKTTMSGVYPYAIVADTEIMKKAPADMIRAGFGDVAGKLTALADWELSRRLNGEYYCEAIVKLVGRAVDKCAASAAGLAVRDEAAIGSLIEALILSGVAMGLAGNSRPASGSEHHLAHYWEMDALAAGEEHPLHGNSVGAATVVISHIYTLLSDKLPEGFEYPRPAFVAGLLENASSFSSPASIGIDRGLFRESILKAYTIRDRFTIMRYANSMGRLEELADTLARRFYE